MNNFEKIKNSNLLDFAKWLTDAIDTGTLPLHFPLKEELDSDKLGGLMIVKLWLEAEREING